MSAVDRTISGSSRRSHTKSRKGCKTCKRRHIRCDETFPQCRNCTRHQVRCDYLDVPSSDEGADDAMIPGLPYSPEVDGVLSQWIQSGEAALGNFRINLRAQGPRYTVRDLRFLYHEMVLAQSYQSREFTGWSHTSAQALVIAQQQPFLLDAILASSAFGVSFDSGSEIAKGLAYQYSSLAVKGLQDAIGCFSRDNADAVLMASILLSAQANEWRSWVSLVAGTRTVVNAMQSFREESSIPEVVNDLDKSIPQSFPNLSRPSLSDDFQQHYTQVLHQTTVTLDNLMRYLAGRPQESNFVDQLRDYMRRLIGVRVAYSPEEQFQHLYAFRKWLVWVPSSWMNASNRDHTTLVVLAYLYTIALQMDAIFPNVGPVFVACKAERPLQEIFQEFDKLQMQQAYGNQQLETQLQLLLYPRQIAAEYFSQKRESRQGATIGVPIQGPSQFSFEGYRQDLAVHMGVPAIPPPQESPGFGFDPRSRRPSHFSSPPSRTSPLPEAPILRSDSGTIGSEQSTETSGYQAYTRMSGSSLTTEPLEEVASYGPADVTYSSEFVLPPSTSAALGIRSVSG